MKAWWRDARTPVLDIAIGMAMMAAVIGLAFVWRERPEPMDANHPEMPDGCPLIADLPSGYALLGRGVLGRDEARKAYPRTMSVYTAPDGSWLVGYDAIGTGEYLCIADQGVRFTLETTGHRP